MLGVKLADPNGVENMGVPAERDGLNLLSIHTVFGTEKKTRPVSGQPYAILPFCCRSLELHPDFEGYEVHMGDTYRTGDTRPFAQPLHREW